MKRNIYSSVEFGSYSIKLLVSEFIEDKQNILFIDEIKTTGIQAGTIEHKEVVVRDLRKLIHKAEDFLNAKLKSIVLMLPSINLRSKEISYDLTITENRVQGKHIKNLFNKVYTDEINNQGEEITNREIAFMYPRKFWSTKSRRNMTNPINEITRELLVSLEVIYEDKQTMFDYAEVLDEVGLDILDIMPNVVAYQNSLLSREEMAEYAVVVDIGDMTTTITVFHDNLVYKSESFNIGANSVTKALEENLGLNFKDALEFKVIHGQTVSKEATEEIVFEQKFNDGSITYITNEYVASLIDEKYLDIIRVIRQYLLEIGVKNKVTKYILIGGAVAIFNFETLFKHNFGENVTIRRPDFIGTRHPKYSSIISGHSNIHYLKQIFEEEYEMVIFNEEDTELVEIEVKK